MVWVIETRYMKSALAPPFTLSSELVRTSEGIGDFHILLSGVYKTHWNTGKSSSHLVQT